VQLLHPSRAVLLVAGFVAGFVAGNIVVVD
jgi:hypothetical protein